MSKQTPVSKSMYSLLPADFEGFDSLVAEMSGLGASGGYVYGASATVLRWYRGSFGRGSHPVATMSGYARLII